MLVVSSCPVSTGNARGILATTRWTWRLFLVASTKPHSLLYKHDQVVLHTLAPGQCVHIAVTLLYLTKPWLHADIEGADKLFECSAEKWHQNSCSVVSNCNGWAAWLINPPYQQHIACLHQNSPDLSKPASSPGLLFSTYLEKKSFQHSPRGTSNWLGCLSTAEMTQGVRGSAVFQEAARVHTHLCPTLTLGWARALLWQVLQCRHSENHGLGKAGKVVQDWVWQLTSAGEGWTIALAPPMAERVVCRSLNIVQAGALLWGQANNACWKIGAFS